MNPSAVYDYATLTRAGVLAWIDQGWTLKQIADRYQVGLGAIDSALRRKP